LAAGWRLQLAAKTDMLPHTFIDTDHDLLRGEMARYRAQFTWAVISLSLGESEMRGWLASKLSTNEKFAKFTFKDFSSTFKHLICFQALSRALKFLFQIQAF